MSRTIVHRPYRVWALERRVCVETHDHRDGPCDLVDFDTWVTRVRAGAVSDLRCTWELDMARVPNLCGCALCTEASWRRAERRNDRHRARLELRRGEWRNDID